jgi:hypothetical protein
VRPREPISSWHVAENGEALGHFTPAQMAQAIAGGRVTIESLVWCAGMDAWLPTGDVGHIPVLFRQLARDLVEIVGKALPDVESWASVNEFRARHARGEVGAFRGWLWKAEALARKALPPEWERTPIHHTFVKRIDGDGPLSVVEVTV